MRRRSSWRRLSLLAAGLFALTLPDCSHGKRPILSNEVLFERAQNLVARRKFTQAIELLGDMGLASPVAEDLEAEKSLLLADASFFQTGVAGPLEAQSRYEQFVNFHPLHPKAAYARYMVGLCLMEQAEDPENDQEFSRKARQHFEAMVADLPADNPYGRAAREMLLKSQDRLAEHEWTVARFYQGTKRWPAVIGRLSDIVEQYPGFRRREQAMFELALAQRSVGDIPQSRLTLERQLAEFPKGAFAGRAFELQKTLTSVEERPFGPQGKPSPEGAGARGPAASPPAKK